MYGLLFCIVVVCYNEVLFFHFGMDEQNIINDYTYRVIWVAAAQKSPDEK
jgi:hypothetical protein